MKKALFGIVITASFFFIGRNQPAVTETIRLAPLRVKTGAVAKTNALTQAKNEETSRTTTEPQNESEESPSNLTFAERLATQVDTELFETLYSRQFAQQWQATLPTLKQRLHAELPPLNQDPELHEKEITARLGILKALQADNNEELKQFLQNYIAHAYAQKHPWLLQREAAHTLTQNNDLDEEEQERLAKNLDARARNTASRTDGELIERTIAGDE